MGNLIVYGLLALGVVTFVSGGLHKYNSAITREAETGAKLKICSESYDATLRQIDKQNASIKALAKQRNAASAKAREALAQVQEEIKRSKPEWDRLAALEQTFQATGTCPAGEAVGEVRKGLRP